MRKPAQYTSGIVEIVVLIVIALITASLLFLLIPNKSSSLESVLGEETVENLP